MMNSVMYSRRSLAAASSSTRQNARPCVAACSSSVRDNERFQSDYQSKAVAISMPAERMAIAQVGPSLSLLRTMSSLVELQVKKYNRCVCESSDSCFRMLEPYSTFGAFPLPKSDLFFNCFSLLRLSVIGLSSWPDDQQCWVSPWPHSSSSLLVNRSPHRASPSRLFPSQSLPPWSPPASML